MSLAEYVQAMRKNFEKVQHYAELGIKTISSEELTDEKKVTAIHNTCQLIVNALGNLPEEGEDP